MNEATLAEFRLPTRLRRTLATLAPIVLTDEVETLGLVEEVVDGVELFLRTIPAPLRAGLVTGMWSFEHSARAAPSSFGRGFSSLSPRKAELHFERWWSSKGPLHQLVRGLKMFLAFSYYEHPKVKAGLGYDPERWIAKVKAERVERFEAELAATEASVVEPDPLVPRGPKRLPRAVRSGHVQT